MNLQPRIDPFKKALLQKKKEKQFVPPSDGNVFESLEKLFLTNANSAAIAFKASMHLLNAEQLAKCAAMFAGKGLEIRMAREKGFKDQPINTQILIQLSETLKKVSPAKVIDI